MPYGTLPTPHLAISQVLSNSAALVAAVATQLHESLWLADPCGAILISVYIIYSWALTGMEQLDLVIGKVADPDFLDLVREMSETHDPAATLDQIRAYHFGPRFLVEIEIVMQPETPLRESHDVGIVLQHKIERLEQVERCFVHVDYQERDVDDHDIEVPLAYKTVEARTLPPPTHTSPKARSTGGSGDRAGADGGAAVEGDIPSPIALPGPSTQAAPTAAPAEAVVKETEEQCIIT